jgi:hypothetical protein
MPHRARPRPRWVVPVTIGWVSFVAAGVAEMLFFASFDPQVLTSAATFPFELSRLGAYTLGFVLFWALAAAAASAVVWLLRAEPHRSDAADALEGDEPDA